MVSLGVGFVLRWMDLDWYRCFDLPLLSIYLIRSDQIREENKKGGNGME